MYRDAVQELEQWKKDAERKPLVLTGARQVGKTWLMKEFGKQHYDVVHYFNFDEEPGYSTVFEKGKNPEKILDTLGLISERKILPGKHLVVFDEIQECPQALNALKYFAEDAPEYHIMVAGSLLGTYLSESYSFPVGKVNLLRMYPLTFEEFLREMDEDLFSYCKELKLSEDIEINVMIHEKMSGYYQKYLLIGGMPECVAAWGKYQDFVRVSQIQENLLSLYEHDITKHNKKINAAKILLVYRNIASQLAKENKKFIYGAMKPGARAREYEDAIEWLVDAGLVYRVYNVSAPEYPLKAYRDLSSFKLYFFDVGLLKKMAGIGNEEILLGKSFSFMGAITENYVLQQIYNLYDIEPVYFSTSARGEIDYIVQREDKMIPIEVKSGKTTKSVSFQNYIKKYQPDCAIKYTELPPKKNDIVYNLPLYLAGTRV